LVNIPKGRPPFEAPSEMSSKVSRFHAIPANPYYQNCGVKTIPLLAGISPGIIEDGWRKTYNVNMIPRSAGSEGL
jgi:hypothetical protein